MGEIAAALFLVNSFALGTAREQKNYASPGNDGLTFHLYFIVKISLTEVAF